MPFAAFGQHIGIGDLHRLLLPAYQRIGRAFQQAAERGQLHFILLKCAVEKKAFVHFAVLNLKLVTW